MMKWYQQTITNSCNCICFHITHPPPPPKKKKHPLKFISVASRLLCCSQRQATNRSPLRWRTTRRGISRARRSRWTSARRWGSMITPLRKWLIIAGLILIAGLMMASKCIYIYIRIYIEKWVNHDPRVGRISLGGHRCANERCISFIHGNLLGGSAQFAKWWS